MTISLCPVLMNFSMQITHLNPKWSPALFVFRHAQTTPPPPQKTCLFLPFVASDAWFFFCLFRSSLLSVRVWSGGWKGAAVHSKQLKKRPQNFGIQNDVNSPPKPLHVCYKSVWEQTAKKKKKRKEKKKSSAECNDSAFSFFFFFFLVALHMNPLGTTFSELNICTCFTSPVFSHSSSCLTTALLLFSHPLRLDRPGEREREERGERMVSRRFTTPWICHFEDEVYECI